MAFQFAPPFVVFLVRSAINAGNGQNASVDMTAIFPSMFHTPKTIVAFRVVENFADEILDKGLEKKSPIAEIE